MNSALFELERRRPVWEALSELFLNDLVLDDGTLAIRLADKAIESGYTIDDLQRILVEEVAPALYPSVYVIGGWDVFPIDALEKAILRPSGVVYWLERLILMRPALWVVWPDWRKLKKQLSKALIGSGVDSAADLPGS